MPSSNPEKTSVDVTYEDGLPNTQSIVVSSIRHDVNDLLDNFYGFPVHSEDELAHAIAEKCRIPYNYLVINSNRPKYVGTIRFPKDYNCDLNFL